MEVDKIGRNNNLYLKKESNKKLNKNNSK